MMQQIMQEKSKSEYCDLTALFLYNVDQWFPTGSRTYFFTLTPKQSQNCLSYKSKQKHPRLNIEMYYYYGFQ